MNKKLQTILAFTFGSIFVILMLTIALFEPNPSNFQYTVFRIVISLAAGGVVAVYPGFIEVKFGNWLRAGGALAVFSVVYFVNPASIDGSISDFEENSKTNSTSEILKLDIDTGFMHEFTYAYTVMRPEKSSSRVHQLATWHRISLNNQSKEPINITELNLVVNDRVTTSDKLTPPFFNDIILEGGAIKFSQQIKYPIHLEPKEFKYLFVSIPIEIPHKIGQISLDILHDKASDIDSHIELFLFGKEPNIEFEKIMPATINGKENLLVDGDKVSSEVSYSNLALYRLVEFSREGDYYKQKGAGKFDDGFKMIRTSQLFNSLNKVLTAKDYSIMHETSPIKSAVLSAKTSMNEVFNLKLSPASMLIKYTKT
jgi:hypothetical protein